MGKLAVSEEASASGNLAQARSAWGQCGRPIL